MAEYQSGMPQRRPQDYGHPSDYPRDAAFSDIFGNAPPGRSHTMTSSSSQQMPSERTSTMSSTSSSMSQRRLPPQRPGNNGGYGYDGLPKARPIDTDMAQGYYQGPRSASGTQMPSLPAQHLQQQRQPPGMRPYQGQAGPGRYPPARGPPPQVQPPAGYGGRPAVQRYYDGPPASGPGPALNSDPYRSQSLASASRHPTYNNNNNNAPQQSNGYQQTSANAMRQITVGQSQAHTTAQGRVVPGRGDDRAMSMTGGYATPERDPRQTMSGRIIPPRPAPEMTQPDGYAAGSNQAPTAPGSQTRMSMQSNVSRTMSMASTIAPSIAPSERSTDSSLTHRPSVSRSGDSDRPATAKVRGPPVYPALLSKVAECFRSKINIGDRSKDGLAYKNSFSGKEAVDVLSYIIRTTDRNLALLLGRALDAQKFFHDVTYEHRLRDSASEIYQFKDSGTEEVVDDKSAVNGVFVLLSDCYSPTCTRDSLCYSIACPRRLEQVSRLNLKMGPGLKKDEIAGNDDEIAPTDEQKLWINTVPKKIKDNTSDKECKRQEIISELCYTERDFCKDLEYLRDFWINPLKSSHSPIPSNRRAVTVKKIFSNILDQPGLHSVSSRLAKALSDRQAEDYVVRNIGDIILEFAGYFEPFIVYGSKQLEAKTEFENERSINGHFSRFVDEIERRKESRKLELNGYLTKPTTRLARYPLLLKEVLKNTQPDNPDIKDIPKALELIRTLLTRVNDESGKAETRVNLMRLHESLKWRPGEKTDLKLTDPGRELLQKVPFKKTADSSDIVVYLFDHAVLMVKNKYIGKVEQPHAYKRPIPLELLSIREMDEVVPNGGALRRTSSSILPNIRNNNDNKKGSEWPITFKHMGKQGYELTLFAQSQHHRQKWLESCDAAQEKLRNRIDFLNTSIISRGFFTVANKVNCVVPVDGRRKLLYGTDAGIYISERRAGGQPKKILDAGTVTQIEVLEEYGLVLVMANKSLMSYPLSALDPNESALSKRPKKIQSHCTYFKAGVCLGRHLVCAIKPTALSTTIKVYEPNDAMSKGKKQKGIGKMFSAGQDEFKPFKEFYIPSESTSVHFLKSKICVACSRGFEVVSLETLETQALLDQADTSLDFVAKREGVRPIHIERLNGEFLLNYSEFSFFVNRNGWRARPDWRIDWEGNPQAFALMYPWLLAFEPNFIEFRSMENGAVHIVPHKGIRLLHSSSYEMVFAYEDERGEIVIEALDFFGAQRRSGLPPEANGSSSPDRSGSSSRPLTSATNGTGGRSGTHLAP